MVQEQSVTSWEFFYQHQLSTQVQVKFSTIQPKKKNH